MIRLPPKTVPKGTQTRNCLRCKETFEAERDMWGHFRYHCKTCSAGPIDPEKSEAENRPWQIGGGYDWINWVAHSRGLEKCIPRSHYPPECGPAESYVYFVGELSPHAAESIAQADSGFPAFES